MNNKSDRACSSIRTRSKRAGLECASASKPQSLSYQDADDWSVSSCPRTTQRLFHPFTSLLRSSTTKGRGDKIVTAIAQYAQGRKLKLPLRKHRAKERLHRNEEERSKTSPKPKVIESINGIATHKNWANKQADSTGGSSYTRRIRELENGPWYGWEKVDLLPRQFRAAGRKWRNFSDRESAKYAHSHRFNATMEAFEGLEIVTILARALCLTTRSVA